MPVFGSALDELEKWIKKPDHTLTQNLKKDFARYLKSQYTSGKLTREQIVTLYKLHYS